MDINKIGFSSVSNGHTQENETSIGMSLGDANSLRLSAADIMKFHGDVANESLELTYTVAGLHKLLAALDTVVKGN